MVGSAAIQVILPPVQHVPIILIFREQGLCGLHLRYLRGRLGILQVRSWLFLEALFDPDTLAVGGTGLLLVYEAAFHDPDF